MRWNVGILECAASMNTINLIKGDASIERVSTVAACSTVGEVQYTFFFSVSSSYWHQLEIDRAVVGSRNSAFTPTGKLRKDAASVQAVRACSLHPPRPASRPWRKLEFLAGSVELGRIRAAVQRMPVLLFTFCRRPLTRGQNCDCFWQLCEGGGGEGKKNNCVKVDDQRC